MTSSFKAFDILLPPQRCVSARYVSVAFKNNSNSSLSIRITRVQICVDFIDANGCFRDATSYNIIASGCKLDRDYRIDLDPLETRDYSVLIDTGFEANVSFDFRITATDNTGLDVTISGKRTGSAEAYEVIAENSPLTPSGEDAFRLIKDGVVVRVKGHPGLFRITAETGRPNDFGIFDRHQINPTAAYIAVGRDGYRNLCGKFSEHFEWDRDTVANPPDDLNAVHITALDPSGKHGWVFRTDLILTDERGHRWNSEEAPGPATATTQGSTIAPSDAL